MSPSLAAPPAGRVSREVYLDNNATTRALPEVVEAVTRAMVDGFGNPSSLHRAGARARSQIHGAREQVAATLAADSGQVLFTSGATEANNLVLQSLRYGKMRGFDLVTSRIEHSSVLAAAESLLRFGSTVTFFGCRSQWCG